MEIEVPYGQEKLTINIPDKNIQSVIYPKEVAAKNEKEILLNAIKNPINSLSFTDFISDAEDLLFIVNDGTRPTPTAKILDVLYNEIKDKNVKFIIATGNHRAPTDEEFKFIFGKYYDKIKVKVYVHNAKKEEDMVYIGTSRNGTELWINKIVNSADKIVTINSVEPHYFAGYTGGRKSFLPGISSYKTIEQNHKQALQPSARTFALKNNPLNEDMEDLVNILESAGKEIFSIQTVIDKEHKVYSATAGNIEDSFLSAIPAANEVFCVPLKEKADIVIAVAPYPMDVDLYQAQKAIQNAKSALKEGSILVLVSKCRMGIGEPAFFELLAKSESYEDVLRTAETNYKLSYHTSAKMAEITTWAELWGMTDLDDNDMKSAFILPFHSLQDVIDRALIKKGSNAKILFLMDGTMTVPIGGNCG